MADKEVPDTSMSNMEEKLEDAPHEYVDAIQEIPIRTAANETESYDDENLAPLQDDVELGQVQRPKFKRDRNKRLSLSTDLETGQQGGRSHHAFVRCDDEREARAAGDRRRTKVMNRVFGTADSRKDGANEDNQDSSSDGDGPIHDGRDRIESKTGKDEVEVPPQPRKQYRLLAVKPRHKGNKFMRWLGIGDGVSIYDGTSSGLANNRRWDPNDIVVSYLHWAFRSNFTVVILSAVFVFLLISFLFALVIWILGRWKPYCIGGVDFETSYFTDAFLLSWTTFSTVGYGLIYSGITIDNPHMKRCTGITIVVSLEAYVGMLYASICLAVLFAKVGRIQSFAQVIWSDPIVVRYGTGVQIEASHEQNNDVVLDEVNADDDKSNDEEYLPCPLLEFRLMNRLNSASRGEIIDASISIVASIDASQAFHTPTTKMRRRNVKRGKRGTPKGLKIRKRSASKKMLSASITSEAESTTPTSFLTRPSSTRNFIKPESLVSNVPIRQLGVNNQLFEEDPTGHLVPRRIFTKLEVESTDHPFFKRVWMVRHRLDEHSPLLKAHVRQMVKKNKGSWPKNLNSAEGVRASFHFDQILVSFSGTSNADGNSVYTQKVYDYVDVCIGYRFVNTLYKDGETGSLRVDTSLVNDITVQAGGGNEPFSNVHGENLDDMLVL